MYKTWHVLPQTVSATSDYGYNSKKLRAYQKYLQNLILFFYFFLYSYLATIEGGKAII